MCSILCVDKKIENIGEVNHYLKFRGPDDTKVFYDNNFFYGFTSCL